MGALVDTHGEPLQRAVTSVPARRAQTGGAASVWPSVALGAIPYSFPYEASAWLTQEMGNWLPWIRSPDAEINLYRDQMVARARDLSRNDGWIVGGVNRILDNTIGTNLRLSANPDYRALVLRSGLTTFDSTWADDFRRTAESLWRG